MSLDMMDRASLVTKKNPFIGTSRAFLKKTFVKPEIEHSTDDSAHKSIYGVRTLQKLTKGTFDYIFKVSYRNARLDIHNSFPLNNID